MDEYKRNLESTEYLQAGAPVQVHGLKDVTKTRRFLAELQWVAVIATEVGAPERQLESVVSIKRGMGCAVEICEFSTG